VWKGFPGRSQASLSCVVETLSHLLTSISLNFRYCRNKSKLLRLLLGIKKEGGRVNIFEGSIQDEELLRSCVQDCRAVFLCTSTNDNVPGCHMAQDATAAVIKSLRHHNQQSSNEATKTLPTIVLLSSGTVDSKFSRNMPSALLWVLLRSASHVYNDIIQAQKLLQAEEEWLNALYVKPAMLSVDYQRGHALSLTDQDENPLSYLDLAAAMIEAANDDEGHYVGKDVSVVNTGGKAKFPAGTPMCILLGLISCWFPRLYPYLPANTGPG